MFCIDVCFDIKSGLNAIKLKQQNGKLLNKINDNQFYNKLWNKFLETFLA